MLNLYLLERNAGGYDEMLGCVVAADSETAARWLATKDHGDEGADTWLTQDVSCKIIGITHYLTEEAVVLIDFNSG